MTEASRRPRHADDLGLRRALSDRLLPLLVAAVVFLAVLALGGAVAVQGLAAHWRGGAAAMLTVQVPQPNAAAAPGDLSRVEAVGRALSAAPGVLSTRRLADAEVAGVVRPWLGDDPSHLALRLPAVFEVHAATPAVAAQLALRLHAVAPGALVEANDVWFDRLKALAGSLQACAAMTLALVAFVAAAVVAVTTRAGIAARRDAIDIVHGLGATDGMIAGRFAARLTAMTFAGAVLGVLAAVPVLAGLASLVAPFEPGVSADVGALGGRLPATLWIMLPALPVLAAGIGWVTAQLTVRSWLAALP